MWVSHPPRLQAYLGDIEGSLLDHGNKASHDRFAGEGSCLQFLKNATSVKHTKVKAKN